MAENSWVGVFGRLDRGESAATIAKELQVDRSTVWRRYQSHLELQTTGKRHELAQLQSAVESLGQRKTELEEKTGSLGDEYAKKKSEEERKLTEALRVLKDELEAAEVKIAGLKMLASEHGLGIEQALALLSEIKNLNNEVNDLSSQRDSLLNEVARGRKTTSRLRAEKSGLEGAVKLRGSYLGQLQQQMSSLIYAYNQLLVSRDNLRAWWGGEGLRLTRMKGELKSQVEKLAKRVEELSREIGAKEKVSGRLNATLEKTLVDLNETTGKLSRVTTDLTKIRGKSDEEIEVSRIRVQAILTSALVKAEEILTSSISQAKGILSGAITEKKKLEQEVSKLEEKIAELKKKVEDLELDYERKMKVIEHRLSEIREAWAQMVRTAEAKGVVLPGVGF